MPVFKFTDPLNPISEIELKHEVFGCDIRPDLLHRVVTWQRANKRQNTHFTKTKSTISYIFIDNIIYLCNFICL